MINKTLEDVAKEDSCRYPLYEDCPPKYFCGKPVLANPSGWLYCREHLDLCTNEKRLDL